MSLRKIAVQLLIVLNFVTAIPAAHSQQGNLRGPKNTTTRYSEPQRQRQQQQQPQRQPQTQRVTQSGTYGPVVSSDTLWQIAQNYRPNNSLSIYQVMQAIYELNPTAFEQQNINLLKDDSILTMPQESYIAGINIKQAQDRSERDTQNLPSSTSNQLKQKVISAAAFDQTKALLEQKLGAIDKAQNRQFIAIRKQFAESINGVQSILDENKNLFERLDKVNADINEMRSEEEKKSLQMNQMGESIKELLEKSRQDDAEKAALLAQTETSLLDNPITLILLFTLPVLLILVGFAYWMIKRNSPLVVQSEDDDMEDISLDPLTAEMDDLSDALSAQLSGESSDELEDDSLFGDDDLLDDVLSEELEESLDDVLEDSIEEPLSDGHELFDELGDDELEEEFEVGADVVEQDDLDSLFDEDDDDDDLLAEVDKVISADMTDDSVDDLLAEVQESDDSANMLIEEDDQVVANIDDKEYKEDDSLLAAVEVDDQATTQSIVDEQEQPEISIDDLLNIPEGDVIENLFIDDSKEINEEVLQDIDKEISSQNTDLDSVTGTLLDELEQVEQMRSMLPDEDEDEDEDEKSQLDIQKLDHLAQQIDEGLLTDDLSKKGTDDSVEVDMSDILNETIQSEPVVETEASVELEPDVEVEAIVESGLAVETEEPVEPVEPVQPEQAEEPAEPEPDVESERSVEPKPNVETEASFELEPDVEFERSVESELNVETEASFELEPDVEFERSVESEPNVETEASFELAPDVETEEPVQPEQTEALAELEPEADVESEALAEPEPDVEAEASFELEPDVEFEALAEPEPDAEAEALAEPEPDVEAEALAEPEPDVESEALAEPEPDVESEALAEPEPNVESEALAEPEPNVESEALAEPEPDVESEALVEPEADVESEALAEPEADVEAEALAEPEPDVESEALAEPEPDVESEALAEPEPDVDNNIDEDDWFDTDSNADQEFDVPNGSNSVLDEDQLDKALEDFENEELDEVLENTTSNAAPAINSLDDLAFSADDFVAKEHRSEPVPLPSLDGFESIGGSDDSEDFDDSELENAFYENVDDLSLESPQNSNDGLDDLPRLGDWLDEGEAKPDKQTKDTIEALEESSFDEMLESIDFDDDLSVAEENDTDTGFDTATLLDETAQNTDVNDPDTEDFLDVETLLNESLSAESEDEIDTALNLEFPLEPFINEQDNLKMIDVDADDGLGAKLDLAHAYIEIGEEESAKELLDEILNKGSAEQIAAVKTILDKLN
jgi:pilus assembly protein FimV